jgi:hypothetical protein
MPELVQCRPCGYVTRKNALRRVCPACGAPLTAFAPYKDRVSPWRRFIVSLDLHPILVHAPQAFATFLPAMAVMAIVFPAVHPVEMVGIVYFMVLVLPVSVVGAILTGLLDGKVKYKRLTPPLVVWKIIVGAGMLLVTTANAAILLAGGFRGGTRILVLALAAATLVCAVLLGNAGKQLIVPILPGPMPKSRRKRGEKRSDDFDT